jgi:hypothetical protein
VPKTSCSPPLLIVVPLAVPPDSTSCRPDKIVVLVAVPQTYWLPPLIVRAYSLELQEVLIGISGTQQKPPGFPDGLFVSQTSFAILRRRTAVTTIPRGGAGCRSSSPN